MMILTPWALGWDCLMALCKTWTNLNIPLFHDAKSVPLMAIMSLSGPQVALGSAMDLFRWGVFFRLCGFLVLCSLVASPRNVVVSLAMHLTISLKVKKAPAMRVKSWGRLFVGLGFSEKRKENVTRKTQCLRFGNKEGWLRPPYGSAN